MSEDILEGVTRRLLMEFIREELEGEVRERPIDRTELYIADEIFLVGTGCQVSYVRAVDKRAIGDGARGPVTAKIQQAYEDAVYGRNPTYAAWLTPT